MTSQDTSVRSFPSVQALYDTLDPLLSSFLARFSHPGYLAGFFCSIREAIESIQANPFSYAESILSILGGPLALTVFGLNFELANRTKTNLSTDPPNTAPSASILAYDFNVKIGDKDNIFDGLYGFFTTSPDETKGVSFNRNRFYAHHEPPNSIEGVNPNEPYTPIDPSATTVRPFYADPHSTSYTSARTANQRAFAGIVDPFVAVNAYNAILPIRQLRLAS